uniref:ARID domain-containing protein n=1 Tax=Picocystis salinarum TaxID=88271 RepID=A0A7S3U9B8_9CHLO
MEEEEAMGNDGTVPERVQVMCNGYEGWLDLKTFLVYHGETTMRPTEFERYCGKGASKKWRNSVWKLDEYGNRKQTIGSYLVQIGLQSKSVIRKSKGGKLRTKPRYTKVDVQDPFAWEDLPIHYMPEPLPPMKEEQGAATLKFDIRNITTQDLAELAAFTRREDPRQNTLDVAPPVLQKNLPKPEDVDAFSKASVSKVYALGHSKSDNIEKRVTEQTILEDSREAYDALYAHIFGKADAPWDVINQGMIPKVLDKDLDLRLLFLAVQEEGGYDMVNLNKQWDAVAAAIDCQEQATTSATILEGLYKKYLLAFQKRWEEEQGGEDEDAPQEDDTSEGDQDREMLEGETGGKVETKPSSTSMDVDEETGRNKNSGAEWRVQRAGLEGANVNASGRDPGCGQCAQGDELQLKHHGTVTGDGPGSIEEQTGREACVPGGEETRRDDGRETQAPWDCMVEEGETEEDPTVPPHDHEGGEVEDTKGRQCMDALHAVGASFPARKIVVVDSDNDSDAGGFL